jgi:hypothetical protein
LLGVDGASLAADRPLLGQLLETFVFQELRRQASGQDDPLTFFHYRDKDGAEVDLVIERGARELAGVEAKASATLTAADFRGLRRLRDVAGARFAGGHPDARPGQRSQGRNIDPRDFVLSSLVPDFAPRRPYLRVRRSILGGSWLVLRETPHPLHLAIDPTALPHGTPENFRRAHR